MRKDTKLKELALKTRVETSNLGSKIWDGDRRKICVQLLWKAQCFSKFIMPVSNTDNDNRKMKQN